MIGFLTSAPPAVELIKCTKTDNITVRIGNIERTMSIGDWSRLIAMPKRQSPNEAA